MDINTIRQALLLSTLINMGILIFWALLFIFARDVIYRLHTRWFAISSDRFDAIHYCAMAFYKIAILLLNFTPWLALTIIGP
ncbi:hypothetical protein FEF65_01485 [Mariprofundus erugo]|uniref:DUF6868 domain-containing protein n=1 Tax=Mariprofundus erugo TaxID=2528639 RepID=A0A5R9GYU6_9PROT|nr:hypothetical protein [Mariprofundus erugo]TLS69183.1 hypothetical protein FEF65_01485 [Mariprofundus erugo]